jgi:hypothetical protein
MGKGISGITRDDQGDRSILVRVPNSTTYNILIKKAEREGRVGGAHRCPICGMKFHTTREAESCCEKVREQN